MQDSNWEPPHLRAKRFQRQTRGCAMVAVFVVTILIVVIIYYQGKWQGIIPGAILGGILVFFANFAFKRAELRRSIEDSNDFYKRR